MVAKRADHTSHRTADVSSKSPPRHELLPAAGKIQEFNVDDYVFYPAHGVGKVLFIEDIVIADQTIRVMGINFAEDQITLRLPVTKAASVGLRRLTDRTPDSGASGTDFSHHGRQSQFSTFPSPGGESAARNFH